MGGFLSALVSRLWWWGRREYRIIIVGLDGAGKTTILNRLQVPHEALPTIPTIGFNVETLTIKNVQFQMWDLGGQSNIRADIERLMTAKAELASMLQDEELHSVSLLILANKQDLPGAMSKTELDLHLGLADLMAGHKGKKARPYHIQMTTATEGKGLDEGFDW